MDDHKHFERDIRHMFGVLRYDIAPCDFHREIIFTNRSSEELKLLGLHLQPVYLKNLLKVRLYGSLFRQAVTHPKDNSKNICDLHPVPRDVLRLIMNEVLLAMHPLLDKDEAIVAEKIAWNRAIEIMSTSSPRILTKDIEQSKFRLVS